MHHPTLIRQGIERAKAQGRKWGRRPKLSPEQQQHAVQMAEGKMPITAIAKTLGCSRHTVYKALASASGTGETQQDEAGTSESALLSTF